MEKNREGEELAKSEPSENCIANKEKTPWPEGLGLKKPFFTNITIKRHVIMLMILPNMIKHVRNIFLL